MQPLNTFNENVKTPFQRPNYKLGVSDINQNGEVLKTGKLKHSAAEYGITRGKRLDVRNTSLMELQRHPTYNSPRRCLAAVNGYLQDDVERA